MAVSSKTYVFFQRRCVKRNRDIWHFVDLFALQCLYWPLRTFMRLIKISLIDCCMTTFSMKNCFLHVILKFLMVSEFLLFIDEIVLASIFESKISDSISFLCTFSSFVTFCDLKPEFPSLISYVFILFRCIFDNYGTLKNLKMHLIIVSCPFIGNIICLRFLIKLFITWAGYFHLLNKFCVFVSWRRHCFHNGCYFASHSKFN